MSHIARLCLVFSLIPSLGAGQDEPLQLPLLSEREINAMDVREAEPQPQRQQFSEVSPEPAPIFWKPAGVGAPARRVAGGVRGNVALPRPTPTWPCSSPTTTVAAKRIRRPPATTLATRRIWTTRSASWSLSGSMRIFGALSITT